MPFPAAYLARMDLNEISAIASRILREQARSRRALVFWAVFPALMLTLFGLIYARGAGTTRSFDATAPGILIGAALFFSCLGGPTALSSPSARGTLCGDS